MKWKGLSLWSTAVLGLFFPLLCFGAAPCKKIVTLAPSVTEVVYALGLGDSVIGVSRYDLYPSSVMEKPRVGGFLDPNYEVIVSLAPSVVLHLSEHSDHARRIKQLGIQTYGVDHRRVSGIRDSITQIAEFCGVSQRAKNLLDRLDQRTQKLAQRVAHLQRPKVLLLVGGGASEGGVEALFVSGNDGFFSDLLHVAGGENVYKELTVSMGGLSFEALLSLDPEIIIEVGAPHRKALDREEFLASWGKFDMLSAVKQKKVYYLNDDYMTVPGPRYIEAQERLARILHSNLDFE